MNCWMDTIIFSGCIDCCRQFLAVVIPSEKAFANGKHQQQSAKIRVSFCAQERPLHRNYFVFSFNPHWKSVL